MRIGTMSTSAIVSMNRSSLLDLEHGTSFREASGIFLEMFVHTMKYHDKHDCSRLISRVGHHGVSDHVGVLEISFEPSICRDQVS